MGIPNSTISNVTVAIITMGTQTLQHLPCCCIPNVDQAILQPHKLTSLRKNKRMSTTTTDVLELQTDWSSCLTCYILRDSSQVLLQYPNSLTPKNTQLHITPDHPIMGFLFSWSNHNINDENLNEQYYLRSTNYKRIIRSKACSDKVFTGVLMTLESPYWPCLHQHNIHLTLKKCNTWKKQQVPLSMLQNLNKTKHEWPPEFLIIPNCNTKELL